MKKFYFFFSKLIKQRVIKTAILILAIGLLSFKPNRITDTSYLILPYSQNWTSAGMIAFDDDWTGVPGIVGYRGDGLTAATGVDPQTIIADGSATPVDVIANQSNPNTQTQGGVAEFAIPDPVIALQGSGTASAPHIVINVISQGRTNITVSFNVRDIDGSADNAVQPVALQYRTSFGNYTNVPAAYIADATSGPSTTMVTPVSVVLPAACDNQSQLQLRIITTNAAGNDEWVGIDDININGTIVGPLVEIFAPDCVTPKFDFNLGDVVCGKITDPNWSPAQRRFQWAHPYSYVYSQGPTLTMSPQTSSITLPATKTMLLGGTTPVDNRGTWRLNDNRVSDAGQQASAFFRVHDPANPAVDLSIFANAPSGGAPAGTNITYDYSINNTGPDNAVNAAVTLSVPGNTVFVSATGPPGWTIPAAPVGGLLICTKALYPASPVFGSTSQQFSMTVTVPADLPNGTLLPSIGSISSDIEELHGADNRSATFGPAVSGGITGPALTINSASVTVQSCTPINGAVDPGETVTINVCVQNTGNKPAVNLTGTLLPRDNVTSPGAPVSFGTIAAGSQVCRDFTFVGNPAALCGSSIIPSISFVTSNGLDTSRGTQVWASPPIYMYSNPGSGTLPTCCNAATCVLTCPANITVSNTLNQCGAVVTFADATTSGTTCGTVTMSPASGTIFPVGTTTVTASHSGGSETCTFTVTVNDNQPPAIPVCPANISVCGGSQAVNFTLPAISDNCAGGTVTSSPASGSVFANGTTTVTVTATDASSNTSSCTFTVTVNAAPTATATPSSQTKCSGVAITPIVLSSATSGTTYAWTRDNTVSVTGIAASGTGNISGTLTNTTAAPVTVTFTITPTANGCPGPTTTATVLVNPAPVAVATPPSQSICTGTAITPIVLSSATSGTTYTWTRNNTVNVTGIAASGSGNISGTLTNGTNTPQTVTFTITPTANGCTGPTTTATVLVNPTPTVTPQGNMQVIVTGNGWFADEISWTLTNAGGTVVLSGGPYPFDPPPTASATVTSAGGPFTFFIEAEEPTGFEDNTLLWEVRCGGVVVASGCIEGPQAFSGCPSVGNLTVPGINGCGSNLGPQTVCSGVPVTTVSLVGPVAGTVFNWTRDNNVNVTGIAASGSGNISGTLTNTTNVPQTVIFTITPTANGCPGPPVTVTFTVNPTPVAVATPASQTICSGVAITPIVLTSNVAGTTYAWTRDNTTNVTGMAASGSGTPISGSLTNTSTAQQVTTFAVIPTANGCAGPATNATVTVQAPLVVTCPANMTVNAAAGTCFATVTYAATITGTPAPTVTYVPASGSSLPIGVTTVTVTATNICATVSCTFTVTVLDVQIPVITPLVNRTVCIGSSATFTAVSTFASSYQWQAWNGSAWVNIPGATGPNHTVNNVTHAMNTNSFRVLVTGPCGTVTTSNHAILFVNPLPAISITSTIQPQLLPGQLVTLTAVGSPSGGTYVWRKNGVVIPGATASTLGPLSVLDVGTYTVTYTDPNGCVNTSASLVISAIQSGNLYIYPNPNSGQFSVRFYNATNEEATVTVYNYLGAIVYQRKHMTGPLQYSVIDVDLGEQLAIGTYLVDVRNAQNLRIGVKTISVGRK